MNRKIYLMAFSMMISFHIMAQTYLTGKVQEADAHGQLTPVVGAVINWQGSATGTATDVNGNYRIQKIPNNSKLVVRYMNIKTDTIEITFQQTEFNIILTTMQTLNEIAVYAHEGTYISVKPIMTSVITSASLKKAACCNLSESFENTAAVDVEYSDAVSGAKQIQMLGLAGIYSQILLENTPFIRLLSHQFGLGFVPGVWMESINVSKGTSSVTNGYESISGQIDVEYKKPETNQERLFLNLYANMMGRAELNMNTRFNVGKEASSMFLLHGSGQFAKIDWNHDSFMDMPLNYQVNVMNRWDYEEHGKFEGRTFFSYMKDYRQGGQMDFNPHTDKLTTKTYGLAINTDKFDVITKNGFLLKNEEESIGTILSFNGHQVNSYYGLKTYRAKQFSLYGNLIYSGRIKASNPRHKIAAGVSFQGDWFAEKLIDNMISNEFVPGIFSQYSYVIDTKLATIIGIRLDYSSLYGLLWTPRFHLKYVPVEHTTIRLSAGKGYRTPHILAENTSLLVSNREFVFQEKLKEEEAWNAGISLTQGFKIKGKLCTFSIDYFYTYFINQAVIDMDQNPSTIYIYNLKGPSYSHSAQAEILIYPFNGFEMTLAYRFNYVKVSYEDGLKSKPFVVPHKVVLNLGYTTPKMKWKFDVTLQYNSSQRLPDTKLNPEQYQIAYKSKGYILLNAQITKKFRMVEVYLGGENLTNYRQKNPIIAADQPFSQYFDASMIYAPITGINIYAGMRFTLK